MIDTLYFTALILVTIRMFCFFAVVPVFFPKGIPSVVKIGLTLCMAYILMPGINYSSINTISSNIPFFMNCLNEAVAGLTLGFIVSICFMCVQIAGTLMDFSIGLSMMTMFDPTSNSNSALTGHLLYWCSIVVFFIVDGHHMLIKALMDSFNTIKLGQFFLSQGSINLIIRVFIEYFEIALRIAIPIVLIIFITDLTMGLVSRTVPQLNILILGLPIKILVGFGAFCFALPIFLRIIENSYLGIPDAIKGFYKTIPILIIFASDDKTEEATPKKLSDARKKGQIPRSKELSLALALLVYIIVFKSLGGFIGKELQNTMSGFLNNYLTLSLTYESVQKIAIISVWRIGLVFLSVVVPIMIMGVLVSYLQTGSLLTTDPLKPSLSKINPLNGLKRMFSVRSVVGLLKDTLIVTIVGYVGVKYVINNFVTILTLENLKPAALLGAIGSLSMGVLSRITLVAIIIAIVDFYYQKYQFRKDMRMSKQEIKEEHKQQEGNPEIKGKIKQKQREMAMRRMMQEVPKATVVVTNPTHISVALSYEKGQNAPVVVAKGTDIIALKIKEIAKNNDVPIIENKPLARLMYDQVEIDEQIPVEMYQAVAEILAVVYKLKKK